MHHTKPTAQYPALAIGRAGTVMQARGHYTLRTGPEPLAERCPVPREQPTHTGDDARALVYTDERGARHALECGAGPWRAWCAEGERVAQIVAA